MARYRVQNKDSPQIRLTTLLVSEEGERKGGREEEGGLFFDGAESGAHPPQPPSPTAGPFSRGSKRRRVTKGEEDYERFPSLKRHRPCFGRYAVLRFTATRAETLDLFLFFFSTTDYSADTVSFPFGPTAP